MKEAGVEVPKGLGPAPKAAAAAETDDAEGKGLYDAETQEPEDVTAADEAETEGPDGDVSDGEADKPELEISEEKIEDSTEKE